MSLTHERSRADHLAWCKERALDLLNSGDPQQAVMSMLSDLPKHSEFQNDIHKHLRTMMMMYGMSMAQAGDRAALVGWIEGWN